MLTAKTKRRANHYYSHESNRVDFFGFFFFLAMKEGVHSIYLTSCQKISGYSGFFLLPSHCTSSTEFSNLPGAGADAAAAQGSLLPSVTSAQV